MENEEVDLKKINEILNYQGEKKENFIEAKLNFQRENRIAQNKKRQELLGILVEKYNKKIDEIQHENVKNNHKKVEANLQKAEQTQHRLQNHKTLERRKQMKRLKFVNDKQIKSHKLLAEIKGIRVGEKQNRDIERYLRKVEYQNNAIVKNQQLIDKCIENKSLDSFENSKQELFTECEEKIEDEPTEEKIEEECIIDSDKSVIIDLLTLVVINLSKVIHI